MKLTLLQLVNDMLSVVDAEAATSVDDTAESLMAVQIANRAYESMISKHKWRHLRTYSQLSSTTALNQLVLPSNAVSIDPNNVYYNSVPMIWLEPDIFLAMTIARDATASTITTIDNIKVQNDIAPTYFTSDDDQTLVFDAIPDAINGLNASLSMAVIYTNPVSRLTADGEYFDLPAVAFPALDDLCCYYALQELKGDSNTAALRRKDYVAKMSSLAVNARLIDAPDDKRRHIVPRRTRRL